MGIYSAAEIPEVLSGQVANR